MHYAIYMRVRVIPIQRVYRLSDRGCHLGAKNQFSKKHIQKNHPILAHRPQFTKLGTWFIYKIDIAFSVDFGELIMAQMTPCSV